MLERDPRRTGPKSGPVVVGWESMAAMEATYEKAMADPELQQLMAELPTFFGDSQWEIYQQLP